MIRDCPLAWLRIKSVANCLSFACMCNCNISNKKKIFTARCTATAPRSAHKLRKKKQFDCQLFSNPERCLPPFILWFYLCFCCCIGVPKGLFIFFPLNWWSVLQIVCISSKSFYKQLFVLQIVVKPILMRSFFFFLIFYRSVFCWLDNWCNIVCLSCSDIRMKHQQQ